MKTDGSFLLSSSSSSLSCESETPMHPADEVTTATAGKLTSLHLFADLFGGSLYGHNHGNTDI